MQAMNIHTKLHILEKIYQIHERFASNLAVACDRYCSTCCTQHVTMTTLEGYKIIQYATSNHKSEHLKRVIHEGNQNRFRPDITINHMAALWARGEETPEEEERVPEGKCPFLVDDLCAIYPARPFGCRCFLSVQNCRNTGFADMDPYVLTANTLFLQFIEHVDAGGLFGNLTDIVLFLETKSNLEAYKNNARLPQKDSLVSNRPIPALLIPPEHQGRIAEILSQLQNIEVPVG